MVIQPQNRRFSFFIPSLIFGMFYVLVNLMSRWLHPTVKLRHISINFSAPLPALDLLHKILKYFFMKLKIHVRGQRHPGNVVFVGFFGCALRGGGRYGPVASL
jgi:hypothetical protein